VVERLSQNWVFDAVAAISDRRSDWEIKDGGEDTAATARLSATVKKPGQAVDRTR